MSPTMRYPALAAALALATAPGVLARNGYHHLSTPELRDFLAEALHATPAGSAGGDCWRRAPGTAGGAAEGGAAEEDADTSASTPTHRRTRMIARAVRSPCFKARKAKLFDRLPYEVAGRPQEHPGWGFGALHRVTFVAVLARSLLGAEVNPAGRRFVELQETVAAYRKSRPRNCAGDSTCGGDLTDEQKELRKEIARLAGKIARAHKEALQPWLGQLENLREEYRKRTGQHPDASDQDDDAEEDTSTRVPGPRTLLIARMVRSEEFKKRHGAGS